MVKGEDFLKKVAKFFFSRVELGGYKPSLVCTLFDDTKNFS